VRVKESQQTEMMESNPVENQNPAVGSLRPIVRVGDTFSVA
jgi:hypothetical protein